MSIRGRGAASEEHLITLARLAAFLLLACLQVCASHANEHTIQCKNNEGNTVDW